MNLVTGTNRFGLVQPAGKGQGKIGNVGRLSAASAPVATDSLKFSGETGTERSAVVAGEAKRSPAKIAIGSLLAVGGIAGGVASVAFSGVGIGLFGLIPSALALGVGIFLLVDGLKKKVRGGQAGIEILKTIPLSNLKQAMVENGQFPAPATLNETEKETFRRSYERKQKLLQALIEDLRGTHPSAIGERKIISDEADLKRVLLDALTEALEKDKVEFPISNDGKKLAKFVNDFDFKNLQFNQLIRASGEKDFRESLGFPELSNTSVDSVKERQMNEIILGLKMYYDTAQMLLNLHDMAQGSQPEKVKIMLKAAELDEAVYRQAKKIIDEFKGFYVGEEEHLKRLDSYEKKLAMGNVLPLSSLVHEMEKVLPQEMLNTERQTAAEALLNRVKPMFEELNREYEKAKAEVEKAKRENLN